ncbi:unnamed protein product [Arabis nemorensis]|uniref:Factor of DNA methylation 1-5/IDN2 domain-containing protein n=1 Tax=Arabis nemorensis TaxID=586526 RepID=A0A565CCV5_9BRAS|nr:unnamed protein product [Arabis nemorensis]
MRYEREIGRLQDNLYYRDNEIRQAKFTVLQALPELNTPAIDPYVDILRIPGSLDKNIFVKACLKDPIISAHDDEATREEKARILADVLHSDWKAKLYDPDWMLRLRGPDQRGDGENDFVMIEMPDIVAVKEKYGYELYNAIRTGWHEVNQRVRTGVSLKPWNYAAQREQNLRELLAPLGERIRSLRNQG